MKRILAGMIIVAALAVSMVAYAAPDIEMVPVKGGCYRMGDTFGDGGKNEKPVHRVCVDDFYIGKYLVTQAQWQAVMGSNPSHFKECGPNCPVEQVSWEDVQNFIRRLSEQTGKNYRLPYEAEWEYAARSGGKHEQWAGTSALAELGDYAWFEDNSSEKTQPVGTRRPNGLGLYDMSGNVWEWCKDRYAADYYKKSPSKNPRGASSGSSRVMRGGSWCLSEGLIRAASRNYRDPSRRLNCIGFRLALPAAR
jgi:sulfatase modifying factor 1